MVVGKYEIEEGRVCDRNKMRTRIGAAGINTMVGDESKKRVWLKIKFRLS